MSWKNASAADPKLDLKLNLSPPRAQYPAESEPSPPSPSMSPTLSPPSSCMSSESQDDVSFRYPSSPEAEAAATSMVLVGCPRCLMYVMLAEANSKCPICKSSVLLDIIYEHTKNNVQS